MSLEESTNLLGYLNAIFDWGCTSILEFEISRCMAVLFCFNIYLSEIQREGRIERERDNL